LEVFAGRLGNQGLNSPAARFDNARLAPQLGPIRCVTASTRGEFARAGLQMQLVTVKQNIRRRVQHCEFSHILPFL
jgi:hypothetical protein